MDFKFAEELQAFMKQMKSALADYKKVEIYPEDLMNTTLNPEIYSMESHLFRSSNDQLIYIFDNADSTEGKVELEDLKKILENAAYRRTSQKKQAIELERFLSE